MLTPERIIFVFDKASDAGNEAHISAYLGAFAGVMKAIERMLNAPVSIGWLGRSWSSSNGEQQLVDLAREIYWSDNDEERVRLAAGGVEYDLICVADPIWFALDR